MTSSSYCLAASTANATSFSQTLRNRLRLSIHVGFTFIRQLDNQSVIFISRSREYRNIAQPWATSFNRFISKVVFYFELLIFFCWEHHLANFPHTLTDFPRKTGAILISLSLLQDCANITIIIFGCFHTGIRDDLFANLAVCLNIVQKGGGQNHVKKK